MAGVSSLGVTKYGAFLSAFDDQTELNDWSVKVAVLIVGPHFGYLLVAEGGHWAIAILVHELLQFFE
jgi:hypothetical protein